MQLYAYRNTERGSVRRLQIQRQEEEREAAHLRRLRQQAHTIRGIVAEIDRQKREEEHRRKLLAMQREEIEALMEKGRQAARLFNAADGNARSLHRIIQRICRATKFSRTEVMANRRHTDIVFARQAICYWACRLTVLSLPQIGRALGGRDHTTILHAKRAYVAKRAAQGRTLREVR